MKPILFAGSASPYLGSQIVKKNQFELGQSKLTQFNNSEIKVTIETLVDDRECLVVQSTANPTNNHLMELFFMIDALEREGAAKITALIPYFGYARQNIQHQKGECVSMNVIVRFLENLKTAEIISVDIHDEGSMGIFSIPFRHFSTFPLLGKKIYQDLEVAKLGEQNFIIGSPDQGGIERTRFFTQHFYAKQNQIEIAVVEKERQLSTAHVSKALDLYGDVKDKTIILVDDIATSGNTIINAAKLCLSKGAKDVYACVVHADFAPGIAQAIQSSVIKKLYTTNTVENSVDDLKQFDKIEIIDISRIFKF